MCGDIAAFERCNGLWLCGWTGGGVEQRGGQLLQHFLLPWCAAFEQIRDLQKLVGCAFPNADAFAPAAEGVLFLGELPVVHIVDNGAAQRIMRDCHTIGHPAQPYLGHLLTARVLPFSQMKIGHRLIVQPGVVKGRGLRLRFQRGRPSSGQALCRTASIRRAAGGRQGVCIHRGGRCFRRLRRSTPGRGRSSIPIRGRLIVAFFHFLISYSYCRIFRALWSKASVIGIRWEFLFALMATTSLAFAGDAEAAQVQLLGFCCFFRTFRKNRSVFLFTTPLHNLRRLDARRTGHQLPAVAFRTGLQNFLQAFAIDVSDIPIRTPFPGGAVRRVAVLHHI